MLSKYPQSDFPVIPKTPQTSFQVEDSGMRVSRSVTSRVVTYTDMASGNTYTVVAVAWELSGNRIRKALYINGVYQYKGNVTMIKDARNNALFNMVANTEKAVLYMLDYAESLVKHMAFNDALVAAGVL